MNRFTFLNNPKSDNPKFNRQRNVSGGRKSTQNEGEVESDESKIIQEFQKDRLRGFNVSLYSKMKLRNEKRTIKFPAYVDLVRIRFYNTFNSELKKVFYDKYGLLPIELKDFNKTVNFEIINETTFRNFKNHLEIIIKSKVGESYKNQDYSILALVYEFEFIDNRARLQTLSVEGVVLNIINSGNPVSKIQKETIFKYLKESGFDYSYTTNIPDLVEVKKLNREALNFIADNFDIVGAITSSRTERIKPGLIGPNRDYNFSISIPRYLTTIGVIDTGVEMLEPIRNAITSTNVDHTNNGANWDEVGHGTLVSGLIILGDEFYKEAKKNYVAKAKIFPIKIIQQSCDPIDIPRLLNDIIKVKYKYGIRLFNMSIVIPGAKKYNDTFSQFAFELDKLAHIHDILFFLSVGNFNDESLKALIEDYPHPDHEYPDFFYKLDATTDNHTCEDTNICVPSESLNNISIGALAGNFETGRDYTDITPNMHYPAYYTRKFHYDYSQLINSQLIKVKNRHLNKPDFVFEGGDLFKNDAGIEILKSPAPRGLYYGRTCGTSLATPLVTSYAAEILNNYPKLKTQTVKAILINSATYFSKNNLPHFKNKSDFLLKSLIGFGKPNKLTLIKNSSKDILFIIEDEISIGEIISMPIHLPSYLLDNGSRLQFDISLCYSFSPIKDDQLNYLPIHISFNLTKDVPIKVLSDSTQDDYAIKQSISWSEDHFGIDNRLLSNAQSMQYRLQPNDLTKLGNSVAVAIRCLAKNEYKDELERINHQFSLVIKITELNKNENEFSLYDEMLQINSHINIDSELEIENELDLEV